VGFGDGRKAIVITLPGFDSVIGEAHKSNEWYTPSRYVEAAREVMGGIDLDPASCEMANRTVKAKKIYAIEDDGLTQDWICKSVWLNPPYGKAIPYTSQGRYMGGGNTEVKSLQTQFVEKALNEYRNGNTEQLILLVTANTTVKWFQPLWDYPMCTPSSKITFTVLGESEGKRQVFGNVFVYLGPHEQKFIEVFSQFGRITKAIDTPKQKTMPLSLWEAQP
jgi:hypothetical protein